MCIAPEIATCSAHPRASGDPGQDVAKAEMVPLDSRLRGNERTLLGRCLRSASWPGLSRPSTPLFEKQDVDARHKAGHDGGEARGNERGVGQHRQ